MMMDGIGNLSIEIGGVVGDPEGKGLKDLWTLASL